MLFDKLFKYKKNTVADIENKKLSLSIRDAEERSQEYLAYNDSDEGETLGDLFKGLFDK